LSVLLEQVGLTRTRGSKDTVIHHLVFNLTSKVY